MFVNPKKIFLVRLLTICFQFFSSFLSGQNWPNDSLNLKPGEKQDLQNINLSKFHLRIGLSYCLHYSQSLENYFSPYYSFKKPFKLFGNYHPESFFPYNVGLSYSLNTNFEIGYYFLPTNKIQYHGEHMYQDWTFVFTIPVPIDVGRKVSEVISATSHLIDFRYKIFQKNIGKKQLHFGASVSPMVNFYNIKTTLTAADTTNNSNTSSQKNFQEHKQTFGAMGSIDCEFLLSKKISFFAQLEGGASSRLIIPEKSYTVGQQTAMVPEHTERLLGIGATLGIILHFH